MIQFMIVYTVDKEMRAMLAELSWELTTVSLFIMWDLIIFYILIHFIFKIV